MKKFLLLTLLFFIPFWTPAYSYQISFPQSKNVSVQSDGIFFAGSVDKNEEIFINDEKIIPNSNGAFSKSYKLNVGGNTFVVKSSDIKYSSVDTYTITRLPQSTNSAELVEFAPKNYETQKNDVVLRSSPVDFGANRMGYLPQNTDLIINGSKNGFSRVYLSPTKYAWISTKDIMPDIRQSAQKGEYSNNSVSFDGGKCIYNYNFSKNLPYSTTLTNNVLNIEVYNVSNQENETFSSKIRVCSPARYSINMNNGILSVSVPKSVSVQKDFIVVLDPGHGGTEFGAMGCLGDKEKDVNLEIAKQLEKTLKDNGFQVILTRKEDINVSLPERVDCAKNNLAVLFVSIHLNSVPENVNPNNYTGSATYYFNEQAKSLANCVELEMSKSLATKDNGIKQASLAVIRPTDYVGILVEVAYMVNPTDVELYKSKDFYKNTADGIKNGILDYINSLNSSVITTP